ASGDFVETEPRFEICRREFAHFFQKPQVSGIVIVVAHSGVLPRKNTSALKRQDAKAQRRGECFRIDQLIAPRTTNRYASIHRWCNTRSIAHAINPGSEF